MRIRGARPAEAAELTELVLRSKAYWGYDEAFMAACADELRIHASDIEAGGVYVAEDAGGLLGVAALTGRPPEAELELLFVDPAAIGRGVGSRLYGHMVGLARDRGFARMAIAADPHAARFYRQMGARRSGAIPSGSVTGRELPHFEVKLAPSPAWVDAWTGGVRAVHLGNVAEYNRQFADPSLAGLTPDAAHHYSCLAAFHTPHPAALVLPRPVPECWLPLLSRQLHWDDVELYDGPGAAETGRSRAGAADPAPEPGPRSEPALSAAVTARPALAARLRALGVPFVPWGWTPQFARLSGRPLPDGALRYESKADANALFRRLAAEGGHPGIAVPRQWPAGSRWTAARLLASRARAGATTVLKSAHGVGGSGTTVVTPELLRAAGGARAVLRRLPRGPLLAEEYVAGAGPCRDLTYDGFVTEDGHAHRVGTAVMEVAGTGYRGATVGPGLVPAALDDAACAFGDAVGRALAADGYRGWFDVDFVTDADGRLAPTETNLRLTGPSVAFMVQARLDELRGGRHLVRVVDRLELGARLPEPQLADHLSALARRCAELGAVFLPAIPTAAFEAEPWLGVVLAAADPADLAAAEDRVRADSLALGGLFAGVSARRSPADRPASG
ncbi:GNAT family N-acetyltransferase [Streptomyces sp. NPDC002073]